MAISLTRFSSWAMWGGRKKEKEQVANATCLNSSTTSEWGVALKEREVVKFPLVKENKKIIGRKKQERREETRIDRECDVGDWCLLSGYESDDSDWSIGWLEPLGSDFDDNDGDESGDSFAVLVPCYSPGCKEIKGSNNVLLSAIKNLPNGFSSDGKNYMEQWLASLQNFGA
ncbi:uncharacterized protein [Cicer arietinum]|uniref:Uncharacterized protein LOC101497902 n=1 Tax=Cicer arietinum TaxID=3827 RepID=A0A1S2YTK3_CICAR|nr:uncharacterized protein LOC101497902 [Cicer arietinum]XP_027192315.1 uncharacterized protein LOC101497902 [Cicer arietinum]XP_027192316.1 uncharacterized protein LOC101497902 [Cicer arietinum]